MFKIILFQQKKMLFLSEAAIIIFSFWGFYAKVSCSDDSLRDYCEQLADFYFNPEKNGK